MSQSKVIFAAAMLISAEQALASTPLYNTQHAYERISSNETPEEQIEQWYTQLDKNSPKDGKNAKHPVAEADHYYPHYFNETQIDDWFGQLGKSNSNKNAVDEAYLVDDPEATYHYRTISRESPSK